MRRSTRMHRRTIGSASLAAIAALAIAGCGGGSGTDKAGGSGSDKAGGSGTPVTLRIATSDRAGTPEAKAIEHFGDEVARLSNDALHVTPINEVGSGAPRSDKVVADGVRGRDFELALVPARMWDDYGVTSLAALQAPFLIRNQAVLNKIVSGDLAAPMLDGLRRAGVTGLALLPAHLRHPFGYGRPLQSPRDFEGAGIGAPRSRTTYAMLRALGATPMDIADDVELRRAVKDGRVAGAESSFELAETTLPGVPTATGNVTLYPRVDVLVANSSTLAKLPRSARAALETAAARTQEWVTRTNKDERDAARDYCRQGGRVIAAAPADVERLVAMSAPVYASLETDAQTRGFIRRIRAIMGGKSSPAEPSVTCEPPQSATPSDAGSAAPVTDRSVLNGVYRDRKTVEDYTAAGVPKADALYNYGVHTITLDDGRLRDTLTNEDHPDPNESPCEGSYTLSGDTFTFTWDPDGGCSGDFTATWRLSDGELRFTNIRTPELLDKLYWGVRPFRKIG